jgi:hypothetical protein
VLREVGYGAREQVMRQSSAAWRGVRRHAHRGARDDGEKVNEVLANYGLFRITYVGQSRLPERPFVAIFQPKDALLWLSVETAQSVTREVGHRVRRDALG